MYALGSGANRPLALTVNGVDKGVIQFDATGEPAFSNWSEKFQNSQLVDGSNIVILSATGHSGPNLGEPWLKPWPKPCFQTSSR